jgi:hypothetical protein
MPYPVGYGASIEAVCATIKKIEDNPQINPGEGKGPAINNLPAVRGSTGGTSFEGGGKKKD